MVPSTLGTLLVLPTLLTVGHAFDIVRDYSGETFFQGWDFFGSWDNLTLGDVWWLNETEATAERLTYINDAGNAIIKVDNSTDVLLNNKRNSVRITSQDFYDFGSLWIIDLMHIPFGCSVWPAFWTKGPLWPNDGEIDIIESINLNPNNQMALHTTEGCLHDSTAPQTGRNSGLDCGTGSGCVVVENTPNSFNSGFAAAGGGVWATQFDVSGIYIWFWSRESVPPSISQANSTSSIDISQWGLPSASYPANPQCNLTQFFTPQQLVIDITLCGDWAGVPSIYGSQCGNAGPTGQCYQDNVVGPGSPKYDDAFFEISYVRAYTTVAAGVGPAQPTISAPSGTSFLVTPTTTGHSTDPTPTKAGSTGGGSNSTSLTGVTSSSVSGVAANLLCITFGLILSTTVMILLR